MSVRWSELSLAQLVDGGMSSALLHRFNTSQQPTFEELFLI